TGLPTPGSIGTIFCIGLKIDGVVSPSTLPLPLSLAGITVTVAGVGAPLFAVADLHGYQQINFQVPVEGTLDGAPAEVVVSQNGSRGSTTVAYDGSTPGAFFTQNGTQFGIFQHAGSYSQVTQDNPARPGETVIAYATGLSGNSPPVPTGQPTPAMPLSVIRQSVGVLTDELFLTLNEKGLSNAVYGLQVDTTGQSPIPFMGLAPGLVGVFQVNFILPQDVPSGNVVVKLVRLICLDGGGGLFGCLRPPPQKFRSSQPVLLPVK
ncbi:MAG: hypothetical protein M3Y27_16965, partial [Acidobacteriota bacterium]|nr:hypothetical protein [Acidobacteriota bacterium]